MPAFKVSSAVDSILEAFSNGMSIFNRLKAGRRKKSTKLSRMSQEELKLQDSLSNRPKEIRSEYSQSVTKYGQLFEKGDDQAYSSLAHTLLVLNTGLINLINNALSSKVADVSKSRQSLLLLSESAAANTMLALGQLGTRLSMPREIVVATDKKRQARKSTKQICAIDTPVRPPPSPLLARGGWVRSRSGSSVVSAASAKRQIAQQTEHSRSKSSPTLPRDATIDPVSRNTVLEQPVSRSGKGFRTRASPPSMAEKESLVQVAEHELESMRCRPPSMLLVPADYFDSHDEAHSLSPPPPIPPKIPLQARPNARTRPRPPSAATFMTASTKIGEIPEHKWPDRVLLEEEREELPLPYVIPPPLQPMRPKGRGLKFWKKPQRV